MIDNTNKMPVNVLRFIHPKTNEYYYTALCDVMFRNLISKTSDTPFPISFTEGIIGEKVGNVDVNVNRDFGIDNIKDKEMVADVKMVSKKDGSRYILEMQTSSSNVLTKRFLAYIGSEYKRYLKKATDYDVLTPVTLIVILKENIPKFKDIDKYHTVWNVREEIFKDSIYDEDMTIHFIELPKYIEHKKKTNEINIWLEFLINPLGEEVQEAMRSKEELRLAVDMLNLLNSDDEVVDIALKEALDEYEKNGALKEREAIGEARGKEIGKEIGEARGKQELIKSMIANGVTIKDIAKMLKIETSEVEKMLNVSEASA